MNAEFHVPLPGEHHAHNLLAAITLVSFLDLSPEQMQKGLSTFKTAYGRTETYSLKNGVQLIGDYYNSNPTSVAAALKLLQETGLKSSSNGVTHAVLGDMLELGEQEESFHRELAALLQAHKISYVWLYGPRMKWLKDELTSQIANATSQVHYFTSHDELSKQLMQKISAKDSVLIKGSRGMKMEVVLKKILESMN